MDNMTPNRPYLLRAFHEWILDNDHTPYLVVEADMPHVHVPPQSIKDGQIVLNISPSAVQGLKIDNKQITFSARFGGVPFEVYVPMYAASAIYARENGAGTMFPPEDYDLETIEADLEETDAIKEIAEETDKPAKSKSRSHLTIVK